MTIVIRLVLPLPLSLLTLSLSLAACSSPPSAAPEERAEETVVPIISTGDDELRDLIRPGDPSAFACVVDLGVGPAEFYDKVDDVLLFQDDGHFFEARYTDGTTVEIRLHADVLTDATPLAQAERIANPIGLLPTELRAEIERVALLDGDATAQADGGGEGIHLYEKNVTVREANNRFEETLFHESVHTSLDDRYATSDEWLAAQVSDDNYLTRYASEEPEREDLAETALYGWALLHYPDRVSPSDAASWRALVPNRLAFIGSILSEPGEARTDLAAEC